MRCVLDIINFIFWLLAVPFCIGMIPASFIPPAKRSPGFLLLAGYFGMWALFEVAAVPAVLWVKYDNFKAASAAFTVLSLLAAAAGLCLLYRHHRAGGRSRDERVTCGDDHCDDPFDLFLAPPRGGGAGPGLPGEILGKTFSCGVGRMDSVLCAVRFPTVQGGGIRLLRRRRRLLCGGVTDRAGVGCDVPHSALHGQANRP